MLSDLLEEKKWSFGRICSSVTRQKNDIKKKIFILIIFFGIFYFGCFGILYLKNSKYSEDITDILFNTSTNNENNANNNNNDAFDKYYVEKATAKTKNNDIYEAVRNKYREIQQNIYNNNSISKESINGSKVNDANLKEKHHAEGLKREVFSRREKNKALKEKGEKERGGKVALPVYPTEPKKLRQGGLKLFVYNNETEYKIKYHRIKTILFLFNMDEKGEYENDLSGDKYQPNEELLDVLRHVSTIFANKEILHVYVGKKYVADFTFLFNDDYEKDLPSVMIVEIEKKWRKYRYQNDKFIDKLGLQQFEQDFLDGKVSPYFRSEVPLDEVVSNVHRLVASEFEKKVVKSNKDSLVFFYAPWCGFSKKFEPVFVELAMKFKNIKSIEFFKIDVTKK